MTNKLYHLVDEFYKYLPISPSDQDWGIYVTGTGYASVPPHSIYPPSTHPLAYHYTWVNGRVLNEYQILFIPRGKGIFESKETGKRTLKGGSCFILFPGIWHRYKPLKETGWDEFWISFNGDHCKRLLEKDFFSPKFPIADVGVSEGFLKHFLDIHDYVREEPIGFQQIIGSAILPIFARILAFGKSNKTGGMMEEMVKEAKIILLENTHENIDMQELAQTLNVGYEHFRRCFKNITGLAPQQYHLELKLNRSKELLKSTTMSIKKISFTLGFDNPYYFSKWFKKKTGLSPKQWRDV